MEFKSKIAVNRDTREATIRLYGIIGEKIDGDYMGQEIAYLDTYNDTINIRINSDGGSVSQGLSIVAAIRECKAQVNCYVDGIAASMAAVIAVCGDKVYMNDYAQLMIHDVQYADENGDIVKNLSAKDKKSLASLKQILVNLLSRRGSDPAKISKLLTEETWFNAEGAKAEGLIDEIIATADKAKMVALLPRQLVAKLNDEVEEYDNQIIKNMKQVIARFKLPETATEAEVLTAVDVLETAHQTEVTSLKAVNTKMVDKLIAVAKKTGTITDTTEPAFRKLAETDPESFMTIVDVEKVEVPGERLSAAIAQLAAIGGGKQAEDTRKYNEYSEAELRNMKATDKAKFDQLQAEWSK